MEKTAKNGVINALNWYVMFGRNNMSEDYINPIMVPEKRTTVPLCRKNHISQTANQINNFFISSGI